MSQRANIMLREVLQEGMGQRGVVVPEMAVLP